MKTKQLSNLFASALAIVFGVFVVTLAAQQWDHVNGSMQLRANTGTQVLMIVDQRGTGKIASFRYQGTEKAYIDSSGLVTVAQYVAPVSCSSPGFTFTGDLTTGVCHPAASTIGLELGGSFSYYFTTNGFQLQADETIAWSNSNTDPSSSPDLFIAKDAANVLAVKNGTTAQEVRVYGTTTGPKYLSLAHDGSSGTVTTNSGSTIYLSAANAYLRGGAGAAVFLGINGTADFWTFTNTGHLLTTGGAYNIGDGSGNSPNTIWFENKVIGGNGSEWNDIGAGQFKFSTSGATAGVTLNVASNNNLAIFDMAGTTRANVVAALFNGRQPTLGANVELLQTDATNDDPTETLSQQRLTTTDATVTTLQAITIATSTNTVIGCYVTARRTGGASGAAEDGGGYYLEVVMKNTAGTAAELAAETVRTIGESQAGWNVTSVPSGATELIQVTGAAGNNITWHSSCRTWPVSS